MASDLVPLRRSRDATTTSGASPLVHADANRTDALSASASEQSLPAIAPRRLYVETYGCQMNVADSELIAGLLATQGFLATSSPSDADVILINTCAVREKAEDKVFARAAALKAEKKKRPHVLLGITGCMAEHLRGQILERAPHVDLVVGPDAYRRLPALLARSNDVAALADTASAGRDERDDPRMDVRLDRHETYEGLGIDPTGDGVSGFVTIQRGCDKFCTFCIVPYTRGRERGTPPREILRQVRALVAKGAKEVVLLGQTVNSYRWEDVTFAQLLRTVAEIPELQRIRFTSPYPVDFSPDVIEVLATEPKICKHVHLPLQSGSDTMLSRMHRGYTVAEYLKLVDSLRARIPDVAFSTDIMVGMSGETEDDHQQTLQVMERVGFDTAFTFAYSEREGTLAARKLSDDVPPDVKSRRLTEVIALQERMALAKHRAQVGRTSDVLIHSVSKRNATELMGRTDGFKAVVFPGAGLAIGDIVPVRIERATSATLFGTAVPHDMRIAVGDPAIKSALSFQGTK